MPSRRTFIRTTAGLLASAAALRLGGAEHLPTSASAPDAGAGKPPPPPKPPTLPPDHVRDVVGHAHRNLDAVRALVEETPLLVNACWDWGGGDFETPLQAAAHTGRREIAEYLIAHYARPDLFADAMLGRLESIKAAMVLDPAIHAVPGPHGFTLLHCAKQGGEKAKAVYEFLLANGAPEVFRLPLDFRWPPGTSST